MAWAPDYITLNELKGYLRIPLADTEDDVELALAVTAASRAVDRATNRQFGNVDPAVTRIYTAGWDSRLRRWRVEIDDVMDLTGFLVAFDSQGDDSFTDTVAEVAMYPVNAAADGKPFTAFTVPPTSAVRLTSEPDAVSVTALFGWSSVPPTIKQAALLQASRFMSRRDSPFGVAGSPEVGSEFRLLPKLDPDVALTVRPYYRWWAAR